MKKILCMIVSSILILSNCVAVYAVNEEFNPYEKHLVATESDYKSYKSINTSNYCGGGGYVAFYDVDFGDLGASKVKLGFGWSGAATGNITVRLYDGNKENVKKDDYSGWIHDVSTNANLGEIIAEGGKGVQGSGWSSETVVEVPLSRTITGKHSIYVMSSANQINAYSIEFVNADKKTVNPPLYTEKFDKIPNQTLWATSKNAGSIDGVHSRSGNSYYMYGNLKNIVFNAASYTNNVYSVWMYYKSDSIENKQIMVKGLNSANEEKTVVANAHWAYSDYRINNSATSIVKGNGWHRFVVDCTNSQATKVFIDNQLAATLSTADSLSSVSSIILENGCDSSSVWFDDFSIYTSYTDLPYVKDEMTKSILFADGETVDKTTNYKNDNCVININYQTTMQDVGADNFKLYKKSSEANDSTYQLIENGALLSSESTSKKTILTINDLESLTKYRLYMTGLKSVNGSVMEDDFVEFSTGNINAREGIVYENKFSSALDNKWTVTKFSQSVEKSHSLNGSYYSSSAGSSMTLDTADYKSSIFDLWFYYQKDTSEHKEIIVGDNSGNWLSFLAHSAYSTFQIKYRGADWDTYKLSSTGVAPTEGWHRLIIDCVNSQAVNIYIDGELTNTVSAPFKSVEKLSLENGMNNSSIWYDDLKIYDSMIYSPTSKKEVIKSIKFSNGTEAENAVNVGKYDGDLDIEFVSSIKTLTDDNFALYKKSSKSLSDADYQLAENGIVLKSQTDKSAVLSISKLDKNTKYRLYFDGLTPVSGNKTEYDFIEFETAENIELINSLCADIGFDNGIEIPTNGIPFEICGDLKITFSEKVDAETLDKNSISVEKITADGNEKIQYTAQATENSYIIDADSLGLEASARYRITLNQNIKALSRNYLAQNEVYEFSTSSDGVRQEPVISDDFDNDTSLWSIAPSNVGDAANSGNGVLSLSSGEIAEYEGISVSGGVYQIAFYDSLNSDDTILLKVEDEKNNAITFGISADFDDSYFLSDNVKAGKRSKGWHTFIIDFTNPEAAEYYIDSVSVAKKPENLEKVKKISVVAELAQSSVMADDFKIWNLMDYCVISKIVENTAFICDENYNTVTDFKAGETVNIALKVDNQQELSQDAVLVVGEYNGDVLNNVIIGESANIDPLNNKVLKVKYTIPENFSDIRLEAFCWNSISQMKPLMKASNPKNMTAVFLGNDNGYISEVSKYLKTAYSDINIVNSTSDKTSEFGSKYFDTYVARSNPDILFVDYAISDYSSAELPVKKHMEEIITKALSLPKKPKIVFIYTTDKDANSAKKWHKEVADYYGISQIDLTSAVSSSYSQIICDALSEENFLKNSEIKTAKFNIDTYDVDAKIMSFNICVAGTETNNWSYRKEAVLNLLNSSDADVISMCEVSPEQYEYIKANINSKYNVIHYIREDENTQPEGLAIAYNTEMFDLVSKDRFWLSETPDVPSLGWDAAYFRICVNALLKDKKTGGMLDIYDVHLDHIGSLARQNGLKMISDKADKKGYNTVIMGDFNFYPDDTACYNAVADNFDDCMKTAPITEYGKTYQAFETVPTKDGPIDYMFVSKTNITPTVFDIITDKWVNSENEERFYSDHYPIMTSMTITYDVK